ncbi:MAG: toxin [Candidatus Paceibacterota bacterium]
MASLNDVEQFLEKFKVKLKVFDVIYVGREKNTQTLLDMEWVSAKRDEILLKLEMEDYCEGPLEETMHGTGSMWVFGKQISGKEVYIKIAMGQPNSSVICISFHIADYKLQYPLKES